MSDWKSACHSAACIQAVLLTLPVPNCSSTILLTQAFLESWRRQPISKTAITTPLRTCHYGSFLVVGGYNWYASPQSMSTMELGLYSPTNQITGTIGLPSGWSPSTSINVVIGVSGTNTPVTAAALSNDGVSWVNWISITSTQPTTVTWNVGREGAGNQVSLRLEDAGGRIADVVTGTVQVDTHAPTCALTPLPALSAIDIPLSWLGSRQLERHLWLMIFKFALARMKNGFESVDCIEPSGLVYHGRVWSNISFPCPIS